ncbi:MAG: DUF134 domain-containing protein [Candidatus Zapsychrus exili]|nr:DUF134 domain-containing protein [Candidatus Zapsychrus exili]
MNKGRRKKVRYVQEMPSIAQFSPRGKPGRPDEAQLLVDQFEAIKLADYQGYDQSEGAQIMGLSRPSFGRILRQGRKIIADALVNGKTIRVRVGDVQVGLRQRSLPKKDTFTENISAQQAEENIRKQILNFSTRHKHQISTEESIKT